MSVINVCQSSTVFFFFFFLVVVGIILLGKISNKIRWEEETYWCLRLMPMRGLLTGGIQNQEKEFRHLCVVSLMPLLEHLSSP